MKRLTATICLTIAVLLGSVSKSYADSMLCIAEKSVGFEWEQEQWMPIIFSTNSKFILRTATDVDKDKATKYMPPNRFRKDQITHVLSRFGFSSLHPCRSGKIAISCDTDFGEFHFRKRTQRFVIDHGLGTVLMDQSQVREFKKKYDVLGGSNVETGSCSKI
tara:strand:- start:2299 stop:2784 length:486 start_codon:yes stop_codon:yes gene_type:complete